MNWLMENKEWLFSGVGATVLLAVIGLMKRRGNGESVSTKDTVNIVNNVNATVSPHVPASSPPSLVTEQPTDADIRRIKDVTRILFVDDDSKFKVVKILKNAGWSQTTLVKDISSLTDPSVVAADVIFVDIQGVGTTLGFKDEGLGLANALKDRYPQKKIVIYSAEPKGAMFHQALRKADGSIEKNADPYEFERMIAGFVGIV